MGKTASGLHPYPHRYIDAMGLVKFDHPFVARQVEFPNKGGLISGPVFIAGLH